MEYNKRREIDLVDMIIDWLAHWRSIIVFVLLGTCIAGIYIYTGKSEVPVTTSDNDINVLAETSSLSMLTEKQLSKITIKEMEDLFLSRQDIIAAEECINLYEEYLENIEKYEGEKESLELLKRAETFNYIANSKNVIEVRVAGLTPDQRVYYYAKLRERISSEADEKLESEEVEASASVVTVDASKTKGVLLFVIVIAAHFVTCSCLYIYDKKIKHTDTLSTIVRIPEYTRMIDWDIIDKKKGLDKLVSIMRYSSVRRTSLSETIEINAIATVEKLKNKQYTSVAVVGTGLVDERRAFINQIDKIDCNIIGKSIDSVTHSVNGSDEISGVNAAILAVKVGFTKYNDFFEELQSLKDREVDVIGIAVFE